MDKKFEGVDQKFTMMDKNGPEVHITASGNESKV